MKHSYDDDTITFTISKVNTRIVEIPELNFDEQKSLYVLIRNNGTSSYMSQVSSTLEKMIVKTKAFILIDNKISDARDYQADALEKTINNYEKNKSAEMKHSYYGNTITFTINKVNTRIVDFPTLTLDEQKSLYVLIRNNGTSSYMSKVRSTLEKINKE